MKKRQGIGYVDINLDKVKQTRKVLPLLKTEEPISIQDLRFRFSSFTVVICTLMGPFLFSRISKNHHWPATNITRFLSAQFCFL